MEYNILTVFKQSCTLWSMKVFKAFHELTKPEQKEREMLKVFSLPARSTGQASYCPLRKAHLEPKETLLRSPDLSLLSLGSWCFVRCEQSACCYRNCEDSITEMTHLELTLSGGGGQRITHELQCGTTAEYSLPPRKPAHTAQCLISRNIHLLMFYL